MRTPTVVVASDRAFHLLAREQPDTFRELVVLALPGLLAEGVSVEPETVDDARLDVPAAVNADFVARVGLREVLHAEFQGYRETQIYMAVVAAAARGRYTAMVDAMQETDIEPVIIEDLVRFGIDQGYERGVRDTMEAARGALMKLIERRGLVPSPEDAVRIDGEASLGRLLDWIGRANLASDVRELLDG